MYAEIVNICMYICVCVWGRGRPNLYIDIYCEQRLIYDERNNITTMSYEHASSICMYIYRLHAYTPHVPAVQVQSILIR